MIHDCSNFHNSFFVGKICFISGPIFIIVAIRHFKVCLFVSLNICFGCKSRKKLPNVTNFGCIFNVNNFLKNKHSKLRCSKFDVRCFWEGFIKIFFEFLLSRYFWICAPISMYIYIFNCWKGFAFMVILLLIE